MGQDISDADFVNSFLRSGQQRKMSAIVIYGTVEGGSLKLRMVSNAGPGPTQGVLKWLRSQAVTAEQLGETPADEPPPAS